MSSTYYGYQLYAQNLSRSLKQVAVEPDTVRQQTYYAANIGKVKTVDDFLNNYRLFSYAMKASGLEDMIYAKAFMKKVLTSNLNDTRSFANQLTDKRFASFAQNFGFSTKGAVDGDAAAQNATQEAKTVARYTAQTGSSSIAAVLESAYYESNIGKVKNMTDLMGDSRLYSYVMTAYGLDSNAITKGTLASSTASQNDLEAVLESDSSDPNSTANLMAKGAISTSNLPSFAQSAANQDATSVAFTKLYGRTTDLTAYEKKMPAIRSIDAFLADPALVSVAERAYGIDGAGYSTSDLKKILTSDLDEPLSVANQLGPGAKAFAKAFNFTTSSSQQNPFVALAQDFNFDASGAVASQRQVQSSVNMKAAETIYTALAGTDRAALAAAKPETTYYANTMPGITSLDGLLGDSRLVAYITKAYGLDSNISTDTLRNVLTSDLTDPKSVANKMGTAYRQLSAAFNFTTRSSIARDTGVAETAKNVQILADSYLRQTMENEAGQSNDGVKLALYFQRKASTITSAYAILADPALLKVVQTALNIPKNASGQDIDLQAKQITNRLKLSDFKNPAKLNRFISQFAALYDLQNATSDSDSSATTLFQR